MTSVQPPIVELKIARRAPEGIVLAESAARRLARLAEVEGHPVLLRVAVDGGGCKLFSAEPAAAVVGLFGSVPNAT